jgi:hypothetical protein
MLRIKFIAGGHFNPPKATTAPITKTIAVFIMIISELVSNIIQLTVEGEKFEEILFEQIEHLTEREEEHTGVGLYVYFKHEPDIETYRLTESQMTELFGGSAHRLEKFELINADINVLADTTIHFSNGLIECLEIWNKLGDYPREELVSYELKNNE